MSDFRDVGRFHEKFGLTVSEGKPTELENEAIEFRARFLLEEYNEFVAGMNQGDHAQMADALIDLVYVAMGTAHLLGYPWEVLWDEVQRANMTKERATDAGDPRSKRGHALDVVKPEGWTPPRIAELLAARGFIDVISDHNQRIIKASAAAINDRDVDGMQV